MTLSFILDCFQRAEKQDTRFIAIISAQFSHETKSQTYTSDKLPLETL